VAQQATPEKTLTPEEVAAIEEFCQKPVGQHSAFLQQRLNVMRGEPVEGKYVLLCTKPHKEWVLAQMNGRTKPLTIYRDIVFHDINRAEYEIFRRRWERHFGVKIPEHLLPGAAKRR
jgi:hypothetical protein